MTFPDKNTRTKCWLARDKYWSCLDRTNEDADICKESRKIFEDSCSNQWVIHFDRKYKLLKFKNKVEKEGVEEVDKHIRNLPKPKHKRENVET